MSKFKQMTGINSKKNFVVVLVDVEQILFVQQNDESTTIRFINGESLSVKESIDEIQSLLSK